MRALYLVLAIVGAIVPYVFFIGHFLESGFHLSVFVGALFANGAVGGFTADLLITSLAFWVWLLHSGARRPWIYVLLNLTIGLSCAFPAYLYVRSGSDEAA
jgi:hypothetical protein